MAGRMSFHCHWNTPIFSGLKTTLLLFICSLKGVRSNQVVVDQHVMAVLGKNITLMCTVEVEKNLSLTQTSWERKANGNTSTLAVYNPIYGISIAEEYQGRLNFKTPSKEDATIVLEDVSFADTGLYTCKVATFPLGNTQASTTVTVMVEPKVYVSAGSAPLIDGGNETVVAICTAEKGKPMAEVSWETDLFGHSERKVIDEPNDTITMEMQYRWVPTRFQRDRKLTCVVRHPALETEFRIPYTLHVQYAPEIDITGYDGNWYIGRENVHLTCRADANPPPARYTWTRLGDELPAGVQIVNDTLVFSRALERNDSGVYRCEVANDIGHQAKQREIRIQDPPPTTTSSPTTSLPHTTAATTSLTATKKAEFTSPTLESLHEGNLGTIIGGAVGGALFLILLIVLVGVCYMRKRRTFRGDYYTKQYIGPSDMQKESQLDVLQPHELEMYSEPAKEDLKPKPSDGIYPDYPKDGKSKEWGHVDNGNHCSMERDAPPAGYYDPRAPPPSTTYLPDDYYEGNDSDYVSHLDGSVISRREWYV
ncbi:nectin-3-like protein isoform X1 [Amia ocellicauda]|uniref:nectin-3-like protein isoform X1 n=1 Tax=Amia ocellicauda TaxID=2972642 RepID=UPI0034644D98